MGMLSLACCSGPGFTSPSDAINVSFQGCADFGCFTEREVRKATRDMTNLLAGIASPLERMEALQKRNTDLFAEMKKLERDHVKTKKRADQLQKEKDTSRSELSKAVSLRERLEKLCRELTRENKKMKVCYLTVVTAGTAVIIGLLDKADLPGHIGRTQETGGY